MGQEFKIINEKTNSYDAKMDEVEDEDTESEYEWSDIDENETKLVNEQMKKSLHTLKKVRQMKDCINIHKI